MARICFQVAAAEQAFQLGVAEAVRETLEDFNLRNLAGQLECVNADPVLLVKRLVLIRKDIGFTHRLA